MSTRLPSPSSSESSPVRSGQVSSGLVRPGLVWSACATVVVPLWVCSATGVFGALSLRVACCKSSFLFFLFFFSSHKHWTTFRASLLSLSVSVSLFILFSCDVRASFFFFFFTICCIGDGDTYRRGRWSSCANMELRAPEKLLLLFLLLLYRCWCSGAFAVVHGLEVEQLEWNADQEGRRA